MVFVRESDFEKIIDQWMNTSLSRNWLKEKLADLFQATLIKSRCDHACYVSESDVIGSDTIFRLVYLPESLCARCQPKR